MRIDEYGRCVYDSMTEYVLEWDISHYRWTSEYQGDIVIRNFLPRDDLACVLHYEEDTHGNPIPEGYVQINAGEDEVCLVPEEELNQPFYARCMWDGTEYVADPSPYESREAAEQGEHT